MKYKAVRFAMCIAYKDLTVLLILVIIYCLSVHKGLAVEIYEVRHINMTAEATRKVRLYRRVALLIVIYGKVGLSVHLLVESVCCYTVIKAVTQYGHKGMILCCIHSLECECVRYCYETCRRIGLPLGIAVAHIHKSHDAAVGYDCDMVHLSDICRRRIAVIGFKYACGYSLVTAHTLSGVRTVLIHPESAVSALNGYTACSKVVHGEALYKIVTAAACVLGFNSEPDLIIIAYGDVSLGVELEGICNTVVLRH